MSRFRYILDVVFYSFVIGCAIVISMTFIQAFFSGEMAIEVTINTFGEAYLEFALMIVGLLSVMLKAYFCFKDKKIVSYMEGLHE